MMQFKAVIAPMLIAAVGIILSILGIFSVRTKENATMKDLLGSLAFGTNLSSVLIVAATFFILWLLRLDNWMWISCSVVVGLIVGIIIGRSTEYYTSQSYRPTRKLSESGKTGPATVIISGIGLGMLSTDVYKRQALNAPRVAAFADFERLGFPTRKQEKYKYTDVGKFFEPDYGLNLNRLEIPVNPYEVFKCDVPNMSTALYFVVNDAFYGKALPKSHLPEGVIFGSLKEIAEQYPELVKKYYGKLADTSKDGITAFNTAFVQDGVLLYVPKNRCV